MTFTQPVTQSQTFVLHEVWGVLIVDDERFDRHRLTRLCSDLETACKISNAASLSEFEDQMNDTRFELNFIDYQLPDGTGHEALKLIHMPALNHDAATIMITGDA